MSNTQSEAVESPEMSENQGFMPNLCSGPAVFALVIVGELLALALILSARGTANFDWLHFGLISFEVQWIVLSSAACICPLRRWLASKSPAFAGACCYCIVLAFTLLFASLGQILQSSGRGFDWYHLLDSFLISAIFSGIILRYFYLQQELKKREQAELQARVQALQSRIRPHFLFNSLNSIASLIGVDADKAERLVINLSQLFRASLKEPELVPIESELLLCKHFVDIEKVRLGVRLQTRWKIAELPENAQVLSLLVQPLVENAIYHGVQPRAQGGIVEIDIRAVNKEIVVKVINPYLPGSNVSRHRAQLDQENSHSKGNGIALDNIRSRLQAHYGKVASLRVVKGETDFAVIVRYPLTV